MPKIKHKHLSIQLIAMSVLSLFGGLTMRLWLPAAHAAQPPQQPYYVVDSYQTQGVVYRIVNRKPSVFFERKSGTINSIALCNGQLYFCSTDDKKIFQRTGQEERIIFEHNTYNRDIAIDSKGNLYFSEASGGEKDGRIYQLRPAVSGPTPKSFSSQSFYPVALKNVDDFWAGNFIFDARDNLYLSTGNHTPALIYRIPRDKEGRYGSPQNVYKDTQGAIKGIAVEPTNPNLIYYANWGRIIYRLDIRNMRRNVEFSGNVAGSRNPHLSDVAFDIKIRQTRK